MCFRNHEHPGPQFILTPCTYTGRLCCQNFYTGFLQNLKDRKKRHEVSQTRFYRNTNLKAWHLFSGRHFTQCCTWHSCHNSAILAFHCQAATRVSLRFHNKLLLWRNVTVAAALQYLCHGTSYPWPVIWNNRGELWRLREAMALPSLCMCLSKSILEPKIPNKTSQV